MSRSVATDERLDYADRWLRDGLQVLRPALAVLQTTVDMTDALSRLEEYRRQGILATATHLLVHAVARVLAEHPALHQLVAGNTRHRPTHVNIGLSVVGEGFVAPVLVIERADEKTVPEIAHEVLRRAPEAQQADQVMRRALRQWGRLVPLGFIRRVILRALFSRVSFRKKGAGTFQVSTVPLDWACTSSFSTAGVLIAGQIRSRVVAIDGRPEVRPMMTITLSGDHGIWDGRAATRFMAAVKSKLERPQE